MEELHHTAFQLFYFKSLIAVYGLNHHGTGKRKELELVHSIIWQKIIIFTVYSHDCTCTPLLEMFERMQNSASVCAAQCSIETVATGLELVTVLVLF